MPDRARTVLAVGGILILAAALRLSHVKAGVPYAVGVDEPEIMERVVRMMKTADFNPHFFDWPSLTIYLQLVHGLRLVSLGRDARRLEQPRAGDVGELLRHGPRVSRPCSARPRSCSPSSRRAAGAR